MPRLKKKPLQIFEAVSFFKTISVKTQIGKTVMITATIIPKGLSSKESVILPSKSNSTARVVPQDGQA